MLSACSVPFQNDHYDNRNDHRRVRMYRLGFHCVQMEKILSDSGKGNRHSHDHVNKQSLGRCVWCRPEFPPCLTCYCLLLGKISIFHRHTKLIQCKWYFQEGAYSSFLQVVPIASGFNFWNKSFWFRPSYENAIYFLSLFSLLQYYLSFSLMVFFTVMHCSCSTNHHVVASQELD